MDFHGLSVNDNMTSTSHKKEENNKINLEVTHNFVNTKDNYSNPGLVDLQNNSIISSQPLSNNPKENIIELSNEKHHDKDLPMENKKISIQKEILKLNEFESNMNISKLQGVNIIKEDYNSNNIDFNIKIFIQTSKFEEIDLKNPSPSKIKMETSINTHNSNKEINYVNDNSAVQDNLSNDMNKRDRSNREQSKQIYNSPLTTINVPVKEIRFSNANREKVDNHSNSDLIISKSREIAGNTSNNKSLFHQEIVNNSIDNHDLSQMLNNLNLSAIMSNNTHLNDNKSNIFGSKRNNEMSSLDNLSNNNQYTPQEGFKDYDNFSMNNVQIKEEKNKHSVGNLKALGPVDNDSNKAENLGFFMKNDSILAYNTSQIVIDAKMIQFIESDKFKSGSNLKQSKLPIIPEIDNSNTDHNSNNELKSYKIQLIDQENINSNNKSAEPINNLKENVPEETNIENSLMNDELMIIRDKKQSRGSSFFLNRKQDKNHFRIHFYLK